MRRKIKVILFLTMVFFVSFVVRAQQNELLTNQDVIDLTKANVNKTIIIRKIRASKSVFNLSTAALIELKRSGVDDDVVSQMFDAKTDDPVLVAPPTTKPIAAVKPATKPAAAAVSPNDSPLSSAATESLDPVCLKAKLNAANADNYTKNICNLVDNAVAQEPLPELSFDNAATPLLNLFVGEVIKRNKLFTGDAEKSAAAKDFFLEADKNRTDKQIGSPPSSSGTTSLAVKGGAPSIIGWAVENGAATSSISGSTVTVRVNPFGLFRALSGEGFLGEGFLSNLADTNRGDVKLGNNLRKFSAAFSFDTTRGTETPTFIVSRQQLSAVSLRYEFINRRTPQSRRAQTLFRTFVDDNSLLLTEFGNLIVSLENNDGTFNNQALQDWLAATNKEIQSVQNPAQDKTKEIKKLLQPGDEKLEQILNLISPAAQRNYREAVRVVIEKRIALFPVDQLLKDRTVKSAFEKFANLTLSYAEKRKAFVEEVNKGTVATFEYTNNREPIAPDTSNFRFIWEKGVFNRTDFTFNASLTMYNKKPIFAGVKRIRDFQFALQTETPLGNTFGTGDTTLTFAGRYERLNGDAVNEFGAVTPNTKGDVAVGQIKFTIPIADFGVRLPLSVTFANRTDLIKESTIRANFGFTFDLDPLFARFKPF